MQQMSETLQQGSYKSRLYADLTNKMHYDIMDVEVRKG